MDPIEDAQVELHEAERGIRRALAKVDVTPEVERDAREAERLLRRIRWRVGVKAAELAAV